MTTDTMTTRRPSSDPHRVRDATLRTLARRRGIKLMRRRDSWWIVQNDEITDGGPRGLSIDEAERRLREITRTMPRIAD